MRALLIAPAFFGYAAAIREELENKGYEVDVCCDRPSESVFFKTVSRFGQSFVRKSIDDHCAAIREQLVHGHYNFVFVVGGMSFRFERNHVIALREASPSSTFVAYLWDSLSNCPCIGDSLELFDKVFSFEPKDCEAHRLSQLPLFYVADYESVPIVPPGGYEFDACFVGSVHQPAKLERVLSIAEELKTRGFRVFAHLYMPSRSSAVYRKATRKAYRGVSFSFEPLSRTEVVDLYGRSRAVIDASQENQSGLTMRSIEALGARRKLITSNEAVKNYDFYNETNVLICRDGRIRNCEEFFNSPFHLVSDSVYRRYSIKGWIELVLEAVENRRSFMVSTFDKVEVNHRKGVSL